MRKCETSPQRSSQLRLKSKQLAKSEGLIEKHFAYGNALSDNVMTINDCIEFMIIPSSYFVHGFCKPQFFVGLSQTAYALINASLADVYFATGRPEHYIIMSAPPPVGSIKANTLHWSSVKLMQ